MQSKIEICGARVNNLKSVHLELPLKKLILFVGPSGSGKSSLAIDTLLHEGRRRLLNVLGHSSKTVQMAPASVDHLIGLPTTVGLSLKKRFQFGSFLTFGDYANVLLLLQRIYIDLGLMHSPLSGEAMPVYSQAEIAHSIIQSLSQRKVAITAPLDVPKQSIDQWLSEIGRLGFARICVDGEMQFIEAADIKKAKSISLVVDRLRVKPESRERIFEAIHTASVAGKGRVQVIDLQSSEEVSWSMTPWSVKDGRGYPSIGFDTFNHRNVSSACPTCRGVGKKDKSLEEICLDCGGSRVNQLGNAVECNGLTYRDAMTNSVVELHQWAQGIEHGVSGELKRRLSMLCDLGLGHIPLSQAIDDLSTGEYSRVKQYRLFVNPIPHSLVIVDEPSLGLTELEMEFLICQYRRLIDIGCTVLLVDHQPFFAERADLLVTFGPGAGRDGGRIVSVDSTRDMSKIENHSPPTPSSKVTFLCGRKHIESPMIQLNPGRVICLSGPSGSGKSVILLKCIVRELKQRLGLKTPLPLKMGLVTGHERIKRLVVIEERTGTSGRRSCVATHAGVWTTFRHLLSQVREAKMNGLKPSFFSFNTKGGRCEKCQGLGTIELVAHPLPSQSVVCPLCDGGRFNEQIRAVRYKGLNVVDMLSMNISDAARQFSAVPALSKTLNALISLGLGYIHLGLPTTALSAGEYRRLNLGIAISKIKAGAMSDTLVVIDEPTSGLDEQNITRVTEAIDALKHDGGTILCISNHPWVMNRSDVLYSID